MSGLMIKIGLIMKLAADNHMTVEFVFAFALPIIDAALTRASCGTLRFAARPTSLR